MEAGSGCAHHLLRGSWKRKVGFLKGVTPGRQIKLQAGQASHARVFGQHKLHKKIKKRIRSWVGRYGSMDLGTVVEW